ncbi:MAG: DNA mismatch repair endonuclease MutL [Candidatus Methanoliparum thermophilum]|uniref:DNA mismatch repair protein MutL n=1 Tax=Methanoliparum thermophilum TaxID=2491083 RepID=A0A520KTJ2_METT2|nr:DNA mismatch repair endonuclease MutL [Candidatus Methanoliparum sp. LAM-1]RZN64885.1 MAG: DNA mismatch repair endonuclease MutL [Candidatus Methanoliparum thermophilum]BDC36242.1 DNA mismatch repair protein MutL [Candidatus Methanoliparum sp. LAM-1]
MSKIKHLDQETIIKIAAGEVIERPSFVVKELIENSIDARATKIVIEVVDGGKQLIRVTDNGCGIEKEDLILAFDRYATSKISSFQDLSRIITFGFRGEALASIANVSGYVEAQTKVKNMQSGNRLVIKDGKMGEIEEIGCPIGTTIVVKDLFKNIPARKKYLKSSRAELSRIIDIVTRYAIINHQVSFELINKNKSIFKSVRSDRWEATLVNILGADTVKNLIPINFVSNDFKISGFTSRKNLTKINRDWIFIYVNSRPIISSSITNAVKEAYKGYILSNKYPISIIHLNIDPYLIDINVHPNKNTIRFYKEEEVIKRIKEAVLEAITKDHEMDLPEKTFNDLIKDNKTKLLDYANEEKTFLYSENKIVDSFISKPVSISDFIEGDTNQKSDAIDINFESSFLNIFNDTKIKILGQVLDTYIIIEGKNGIFLIDQHAADERIRYERLKTMRDSKQISQRLLVSVNIELSPREQIIFEDLKDILESIGFDIQHFGGRTYNVKSIPYSASKLNDSPSIYSFLKDLFTLSRSSYPEIEDEAIKLISCRGSIKSGDKISKVEMLNLLKELSKCRNPMICPHGRPTIIKISSYQLEKMFQRLG